MDSQSTSKGEHYNLRWNNYTANLIQVFSEHQHHETLVDVTLTCEGQFIKAHKLILSACSGFFEEMFKIHATVSHPFIVLNGIKFNHLKHILEFIYHGEVKILDEDLEGVLALGENFQVKGLSSVKIKHQVPVTDQQAKPSPDPINIIHSLLPKVLMSQEKENIRDKSKGQIIRGIRRVQVVEGCKTEDKTKIQNGKDVVEPAMKRIRTPETTAVTTSSTNSKVENIPKENMDSSEKIPRPTNAFMIFANEWRKKLAVEHPEENNKGISVKLGNMWKSLSAETKEAYYCAATKAQKEHEMKYPGYSYNPQEARKRKAMRRKTIDCASPMAFVNVQEREPEEEDDLEIIEVHEDPVDKPDKLGPSSS